MNAEKTANVAVGDFTVPMYSSYKLNDDSSDDYRVYENSRKNSVIAINDSSAMYASMDANIENYKELAKEAPAGVDGDIYTEKCSLGDMEDCCYLSYKSGGDGNASVTCTYLIYENNRILNITESRAGDREAEVKKEITELARQARYTGKFVMPDELQYPYTLDGDIYRVVVDDKDLVCAGSYNVGDDKDLARSGGDSAGTEKALVADLGDGDSFSIRLKNADSIEKGGLSKLYVYESGNAFSAKDQAEQVKENKGSDDKFSSVTMSEATYEEVWPDSQVELKEINVYKVSFNMKNDAAPDESVDGEAYYFEYKGDVYCVSMMYLHGDDATRKAFMDQMKNVTFHGDTGDGVEENDSDGLDLR